MRRAAKGANTHKGLIFSLGILCAASGILGEGADSDALCELAARIAAPALADVPDGSHGGHVRRRFGVLGARGEAASGFPAARAALPVLRESLDRGEDIDRAGVKALLSLMAELEDTNVLWRSGKEGLELTQNGARALLDRDVPTEALRRFDGELTARGISPGGSADLLAIVFFLHLNT
jgi:triphosphoribosyl-dephospho-CoA synthetase